MNPCEKPCFMLDHMVIRLGKYLRIAGYDAEWDPALRTHDLIHQANLTGRIFLTRNGHIADQFPKPDRMILVRPVEPSDQFRQVAGELGLDVASRLFHMCIRCNVDLLPVADKAAIRDLVHENVYARHERFFRCPRCGTVFWHGSHVRNTCRKLNLPPPALP